ncbi:glycosyltransferase family 25 protein [Sulfitobacter pseudonitzschiae]|uniref:Glycosyltransferase family 25 protein n=1 Tax=Pseudosulfitobacter pseudonitzschiae TaxID=1402135 RepID=A0A9Q2NEH3_9RHOB|nr:glycosyltransferase family 25 protein [Pseudosulfitobacter pseudonitzschiae]MBM2290361.1 glycosyltransferase family 25 protein [Pseudosulfitobacter pseudonitzschiae]MBM2295279.1 glycosyltransferase family 25 protein [Pseudosulfitobacter pseudonitzschiae]MBM2300191.1 glycosyltransferase family 25 protein [Pseudosulfitobacter pseudonitzschiae]MBM2309976.1 glycosyltransferase family 25 protein [Pseudosulfitobacter pseudonitzschiae]MBM2314888.1 glycosyltransferase family 25 protein [Pseudosulfi
MHSLIIHMSSATQRRANVAELMQALPDAQVIEAVRGAEAGVTPANGDIHHPRYPFPIGAGEVGCFLSHRACWQRIVDEGWDYALIAEDDLALDTDHWPHVQSLIAGHATADSYFRIPAKARETAARVVASDGLCTLMLPRVIGLQTVFQLVGRNAAQRLLAATEVLDRPVDTFLQMHWVHGQPVHTILPNGVRELTADLGGSTIQKKTRTSGKLMREINRWRYRGAVAARPQT